MRQRAPAAVWIGGAVGISMSALILTLGVTRTILIVVLALSGAAVGYVFFGRARAEST